MFDASATIKSVLGEIESVHQTIKPQIDNIELKLKSAPDADKEPLLAARKPLDSQLALAGKSIISDNYQHFIALRDAAIELAQKNGIDTSIYSNSIMFKDNLLAMQAMKSQMVNTLYGIISVIYKKQKPVEQTQEEKLYAIAKAQRQTLDDLIAKINTGNFSLIYECIELIHNNIFEPAIDTSKCQDGYYECSHTFLSYAFTRLNPRMLEALIEHLKLVVLGEKAFDLYLQTPINPDRAILPTTICEWFKTYKEERNEEKENHTLRLQIFKKFITKDQIDYNHTNTHTASINVSSNISHVAAFMKMIEKSKIEIEAEYSNTNCLIPSISKINITEPNAELDSFITSQLKAFKAELEFTLKKSPKQTYEDSLGASFTDLFDPNNTTHKKQVAYFKFQIEACIRFMSEMIDHHSCCKNGAGTGGGGRPFNTNIPTPCGLTIEHMVASLYYLWKNDKDAFINQAGNSQDNQRNNNNIYQLVNSIHDARRGYNIDGVDDDPVNYIAGKLGDRCRCDGGVTNGLIDGLVNIHPLYDRNVSGINTFERELRQVFEEIILLDLETIRSNLAEIPSADLQAWFLSKKTPRLVQDIVLKSFETKHPILCKKTYKDFLFAGYAKYFTQSELTSCMTLCLSSIPMPDALKTQVNISAATIIQALKDSTMPLFVYSRDSGYMQSLAHFGKQVEDLTITLGCMTSSGSLPLLALQISNKNPAKNLAAITYPVFVSELEGEISNAYKIAPKDYEKRYSLFRLYFKTAHHTLEAVYYENLINKEINILNLAIEKGDIELVKIILSKDCASFFLNAKSLYLASEHGHLLILKELLSHESCNPVLSLDKVAKNCLDYAIANNRVDVVAHLLGTKEFIEALKTQHIEYAVEKKQFGMIQAILQHQELHKFLTPDLALAALNAAIVANKVGIVKSLLDIPAVTNAFKHIGKNQHPLATAIDCNSFNILSEILLHKEGKKLANIYLETTWKNNGQKCEITPLSYAARLPDITYVKAILPHTSYLSKYEALLGAKGGATLFISMTLTVSCLSMYIALSSTIFLRKASTILELSYPRVLFSCNSILGAIWISCITVSYIREQRYFSDHDKRYNISDLIFDRAVS